MKKEQEAVSYGFYSKLLKKPFDSLEELKAAEDEYNKAHAEELKKAEERKVRAKAVEDAYTKALETRKEAMSMVNEAKAKANKLIAEAEAAYTKLKDEFIKDYGSFHMSYTNNNGNTIVTVSDLIDSFFKPWF